MSRVKNFYFMVDCTLPETLGEEFIQLIPAQHQAVHDLLSSGCLVNYALSLETQKLWAIFKAQNEVDVLEHISQLPLSKFMDVRISELSMFTSGSVFKAPAFSFN